MPARCALALHAYSGRDGSKAFLSGAGPNRERHERGGSPYDDIGLSFNPVPAKQETGDPGNVVSLQNRFRRPGARYVMGTLLIVFTITSAWIADPVHLHNPSFIDSVRHFLHHA